MTLLLLGAATAPVSQPLTIADVVARHEALDGQTVRVRGWLIHPCGRFSCSIAERPDGAGSSLALGGSGSFDLAVAKLAGHEIVVEGEVRHNCFQHPKGDPRYDPDTISVCTDRADQLRSPRLITVLSAGAKL